VTTLTKILTAITTLAFMVFSLAGCGCGFDCNNDDNNPESTFLSLGFSDESLEQLKQVVIEVDRITFRRSGADDVVIDNFTIEDLGLVAADSFQLDLLQYQGLRQLLVIESLELDAQSYTEVVISVLGDDINRSFVQESDDSLRPITVAAGGLVIPGPTLSSGEQLYTLAFGLARALQFQASRDDYSLTTEGVRLLDNAVAASIAGRIDSGLFDSETPCDAKTDPQSGNRVYLYRGKNLPADQLADVFTKNSSNEIPDNALAPYAVAALARDSLTGGWQYALGFLGAGDYTLAFACDTAGDDPVDFNGFIIPLPKAQIYDIELSAGEQSICDLADGAKCS
jgi:Domain of unknown function (DUF4382)